MHEFLPSDVQLPLQIFDNFSEWKQLYLSCLRICFEKNLIKENFEQFRKSAKDLILTMLNFLCEADKRYMIYSIPFCKEIMEIGMKTLEYSSLFNSKTINIPYPEAYTTFKEIKEAMTKVFHVILFSKFSLSDMSGFY